MYNKIIKNNISSSAHFEYLFAEEPRHCSPFFVSRRKYLIIYMIRSIELQNTTMYIILNAVDDCYVTNVSSGYLMTAIIKHLSLGMSTKLLNSVK